MPYHPITEKIKELLTENNSWFETFEHEPVRTSEEASKVRPGYTADHGAKAIITRVKKPGKAKSTIVDRPTQTESEFRGKFFVMFVLQGSKKFDTGKIKEQFGLTEVRFATEEEVSQITGGILPGGVPPFGNLFGLTVYADNGLIQQEKIVFNAGDRSFSVGMKTRDYVKIVRPIIGSFI